MKQASRYVIVLLVICAVAAALLAAIYGVTKDPIEEAGKAKVRAAVQAVLPEAETLLLDDKDVRKRLQLGQKDALPEVYPAYTKDQFVGVAIKTTDQQGYGGNVDVMVGIRADGMVHAVSILQHKETPGLGSKMAESPFIDQFSALKVPETGLLVDKDGGTIVSITGATISSRSVINCVNQATTLFNELAPRLATAPGR